MVNVTPRQALIWGGFAAFILGFVIALTMRPSHDQPQPRPTVTVTVTVTVTKEVQAPVQVKREIPESCKRVIDAALKSNESISDYEEQVGGLSRLLDDAGVAIYVKNQQKLNALHNQASEMSGDSIKSLIDIREQDQVLKTMGPRCAADLKGK